MIIDSVKLKENLKSDYRRNLFNEEKWEGLKRIQNLIIKKMKNMDTLNEVTIDMFVEFLDKHNLHFFRDSAGRGTGIESILEPEYRVLTNEEFIKIFSTDKGHWWG